MRIHFNEISPHGNQFVFNEITWGEDTESVTLQDDFQATFWLQKKSEAKIEMKGSLHVTVNIPCDRCLSLYSYPVHSDYHILFELDGDDEKWCVKEIECNSEEMDTILLDAPIIDIMDVLRQQIELALPQKRLCVEACKGICSDCGANLNHEECNCHNITIDSPFAVLSKLKK